MLTIDLDDELDDIKVQNTLRESLIANAPVPRRGARPSMTEYAITHSTATETRPELRRLFVDFAQRLADGWALDTEALVDVLTLKDNESGSSKDPIIALEKLFRDTVRQKRRKGAVADMLGIAFWPKTGRFIVHVEEGLHSG